MSDRVVAVDAVSLLIGASRGGRRLTNLATRLRPIFRLVLAVSILAATLVDPLTPRAARSISLPMSASCRMQLFQARRCLSGTATRVARRPATSAWMCCRKPHARVASRSWRPGKMTPGSWPMTKPRAPCTSATNSRRFSCAPRRARQQRHLWPPGEGRGSTRRNLCPDPRRRLSAVRGRLPGVARHNEHRHLPGRWQYRLRSASGGGSPEPFHGHRGVDDKQRPATPISWRLTRAHFANGSCLWRARSMTRGYTMSWTDCSPQASTSTTYQKPSALSGSLGGAAALSRDHAISPDGRTRSISTACCGTITGRGVRFLNIENSGEVGCNISA